jgi:chromosome segregation ATPase
MQVAFTRQGIPAAAAAALEQVCKQPWRSVDSADLMSYAALSGTARAACAAAVQQELQRLGAHQQTLADDLAVLQAVQELPVKQQEMEALQGLLQTTQAELHRLQAQMEQQQQQQQQDEAAQRQAMSGNGVAPEVKPGSDGMEGAGEGQQTALQGEVADATARVQDLHQQVSSLQQLLGEWTQLVSGQKLLAVQFRLEKQQLLDGLVAQLA